MKSPLRTSLVAGIIVLGLASVLVHPSGVVKGPTSTNLLLTGAVVDSETVQIMERSCQNCHSEKTEWPWYSYVAPVSWLVESDVHKARSHMNLSGWDQYSLQEKQYHLAELAAPASRLLHSLSPLLSGNHPLPSAHDRGHRRLLYAHSLPERTDSTEPV